MPLSVCREPACPEAASYRGYCRTHARTKEQFDRAGKKIYWTAKWRNRRRRFLFDHPICAIPDCKRLAIDMDHIVSIHDGGPVWDISNWQGLCKQHHGQKTHAEFSSRAA